MEVNSTTKKMEGVTFQAEQHQQEQEQQETKVPTSSETLKKRRSSKTPHTSPTLAPKRKSSAVEPELLTLDAHADLPEPLLTPSENEYTLFPVQHDDIMKMTKNALAVIWMAEEIDLSKE